jgi:uroporphyrinogen decarboxylase
MATQEEKSMNKIERFRAMLRGEPVDQVPAGFWFHFGPEFHGGEAMARAHLDYYRAADPDVLKVMNDTGYAPIGTLRIREPGDWRQLEPTPLSDPLFQSHLDGLRRIVDAVGDEVMIMTTAFNPYNQAMAILRAGDPARFPTAVEARAELLRQLRSDSEPVLAALGVIAEDLGRFFQACITDAGANGIYYSAQGGEREVMSDDEHAAFFRPYDLRVLEAINAAAEFIVGHFCGPEIALERFIDYPVHLANWAHQSGNLSLRQGRDLLGLPILGGMDERGPLVTGPRPAIATEVRAVLDEMGTQGFMLGAGCTVPSDIDVTHLAYAREVCIAETRRD